MILKKKYFIIFTMSLLMLPLAFSQITIKEKLNVGSPHARTQDESHTLVFSFSRPAGVITQTPDESHQLLSNMMHVHNDACGQDQSINVDGGSGLVTFNTAISGGWYSIDIVMNTVTAGEATLDVSLDGIQIRHVLDNRDVPPYPYYVSGDFQSLLYLFTGFSLTVPDTANACVVPSANIGPYYTNCSTSIFDLITDPVMLRITHGIQYATFIDGNSNRTDSVQFFTQEGQLISSDLWPTGVCPPPGVDFDSIVIEATTRFTDTTRTILFGNPPPYQLKFFKVPINLVSHDSTSLIVIEENGDGSERWCDDNRLITLQIDSTKYGHFIDTSDNIVQGNSLTALYIDVRNGRVKFIADGVEPDTTVTFGVTASAPGSLSAVDSIVLDHAVGCALLTLNPSRLLPGDSASVIIAEKLEDGTTTQFPTGQLFTVTLLDSGKGKLLSVDGQVSDNVLSYITAGFKYIAPDSLSTDSLTIHIEAVPVDAIATISVHSSVSDVKSTGTDSVAAKKKSKILKGNARKIMENSCAPAEGIIRQCGENFPNCPNGSNFPNPILSTHGNNYGGIDACEIAQEQSKSGTMVYGVFRAMFSQNNDSYVSPFDIVASACHDVQNHKLRFPIQFQINAIKALCPEHYNDRKPLSSINDVNSIQDDKCCAYWDFVRQGTYGTELREGGYVLEEINLAHEQEHANDYEKALTDKLVLQTFIDDYDKTIYVDECFDLTKEQNLKVVREGIMFTLNKYLNEVTRKYNEITGDPNDPNNDYEQRTQDKVRDLIQLYINKLGLSNPLSCHCTA